MAQITLRDYLQEIEDAISSKRVDEALASCQYVLAFFPESLEAQRLLGEVYLAQGKLEDAQQAFDWVLTNDPDNVIAYCSRALVSERMSDYDTALDCYQQAYELSRGNGQIRQAFNQLSEKVGQPGFMFSRAGLARLYMRGDLLIQAAQEWDIVLSMYPDRLDARTGLLEVYWRQGLYEKAIPLAEQILRDVPGCIKALLLLAYMRAPQDMLRSQELIKQVEALDPDLVLAHDLFADHMANQAGDPFLKLLSKSPAVMGAPGSAATISPSQSADAQAALNVGGSSVSADALSAWGSNASWNNDETLVKPRSDQAASQPDIPSLPSWMSEDIPSKSQSTTSSWDNNDAWNAAAPQQASTPTEQPDQAEPWQLLQNALNSINPDAARQASDPGLEESNAPAWPDTSGIGFVPQHANADASDSQETELAADDHIGEDAGQSWSFAIPEAAKNNAAVPAWLNMLAQDEAKQTESHQPEVAKPQEEQPVSSEKTVQPGPADQSQPSVELAKPSEPTPERADTPQPEEESEEELPFGPAWLKSLGAASLEGTGAYDFSELVRQRQSGDLPSQPDVVAASAEARPTQSPQPEIPAPSQQSSGASWEQPAVQKSSGASWEQPGAQKSSGASWEQPGPTVAQPKAQGFQDPSWLLESPSQTQKKQSSPTWELPDAQPSDQQPSPAASSTAESALNQLVEASQSAPADADPWAAWQSAYAPSQGQQQPAENQDFWSSFESNREPAPLEQPSWMQQLSQSSASSSDQNSDVTYEESAEQVNPSWYEQQAPEPAREETVQPAESVPSAEPARPVVEDPWAILNQQAQSQSIDYDWLAQLAGGTQPSASEPVAQEETTNAPDEKPDEGQQAAEEQNLVTTLEELEQRLLSRGFTPLEPNSLASIAQSQENGQESEEQAQEAAEGDRSSSASTSEPSLSSALAELGNFFPRPAEPTPIETQAPSAEPSWLAALGTVPAARNTPPSEAPAPEQPIVETAPETTDTRQPPVLAQPYAAPSRPAETVAFQPSEHVSTEPEAASVAHVNPLLDSELETTMKRPAVRLQPVQRTTTRDAGHMGANRTRSGERAGQRVAEGGNISHRERLIRGYQAQLIGDFDNAMQEYRVIIRNAPELLGEVVSNVRALLKLAPNYSSGYRVLGDAYMRQGEYLQAMEAYNKALTMAKKAKA
ncbi:tetratricopeptide repeat protein [Dictyobacter aurantiacus]|uniref:Bacterial transcriptional activator domain-containing protein n=1 Tax=Dictyobacter aurantiacus TaxID=1936993 RepID=A0A401Z871_9CHLR|nr:tetratricopeptide repeat protein [Dictyobacter aurantiacus]GCE03054.1 hypothetical protein KDAU_03830 [Dictyobacter aurantiacus]